MYCFTVPKALETTVENLHLMCNNALMWNGGNNYLAVKLGHVWLLPFHVDRPIFTLC